MSEVKFNFLNWQPDLEDFDNDGLLTADNLLHSEEGYKQIKTVSEADWTIKGGNNYTALALQVKSIGSKKDASGDNKITATLRDTINRMDVGDGLTNFTFTLPGLSITTSYGITAFQIAELNNYVFICAQSEGTSAGGTLQSMNITGYLDVT